MRSSWQEFRTNVFASSIKIGNLTSCYYLGSVQCIFGSDRSPVNANLRPSVRPMKTCLELSIFIFLSQVSLRSVSGQSQVSPRSVSGLSQVSIRSVLGQY